MAEQSLGAFVDAVNWIEVLNGVSPPEIQRFGDALSFRAHEAHTAGEEQAFIAWRTLARLFSGLLFQVPAAPKARRAGRQGLDDPQRFPWCLTAEEIECAGHIIDQWDEGEFVAQLGDLVWVRNNDAKAAKMAANAYVQSAVRQFDPANWGACEQRYRRAIDLAAAVGRREDAFADVAKAIEAALDRLDAKDPLYLTMRLALLLSDHDSGDRKQLAVRLETRGRNGIEIQPVRHDTTAEYFEEAARLYRRIGSDEDADRCWESAAMSMALYAEGFREYSGSRSAASHWMGVAIKLLRNKKGSEELCEDFQRRMLAWQEEDIRDLVPISESIDLSKELLEKLSSVTVVGFRESICRLALMMGAQPMSVLRSTATTWAESPLFELFPPVWLREDGKTDERLGAIPRGGPVPEPVLRQLMHDRARLCWQLSAQYIQIAMSGIVDRFGSDEMDLTWLVVSSPFVPPDRRSIFKRGLEAGLNLDLMMAMHLLVPQLENSLRCLLSQNGVVTSRFDSDDTQDEHLLNRLLEHPKLTELVGEDMVFDLRGLLIERPGANLRNMLAHGMLGDGRFSGADCLYLWWLTLHICVLLAYQQRPSTAAQPDMAEDTEQRP